MGEKFESITQRAVIQRRVAEPTDLEPNPAELIFKAAHRDISGEIKHVSLD